MNIDTIQSPLTGTSTSHRNFAIIVSTLSALGLILVMICVLYFILIFPVSMGTTIIGHQILFGLFLCFIFNFAYLVPSVQYVCLIRQMGLPLAYTIIFSGLFIKAYNFWCQENQKSTPNLARWNSPTALLIISLTLIVLQMLIIFTSGHRYSVKSIVNTSTNVNLMQCISPGTKLLFLPNEVFLPLILLLILCVLIIFLTAKTTNNIETKLILITTILVMLVWSAVTTFSTFCKETFNNY